MKRINVLVDDALYSGILEVKIELQKQSLGENIDIGFSDAIRHVLKKGLEK